MSNIKLHLGCGKRNLGTEWIHIDIADYPFIAHRQSVDDLHQFADGSVHTIYASHVLEYFDRTEGENLLAMWYNKLKPGGILRVSVPDFDKLKLIFEQTGELSSILGPLFGKMQVGDKTIYHKTVYTHADLKRVLGVVGFKEINNWDWSVVHPMWFDDHSMAHFGASLEDIRLRNFGDKIQVSLNIQATK